MDEGERTLGIIIQKKPGIYHQLTGRTGHEQGSPPPADLIPTGKIGGYTTRKIFQWGVAETM